MVPGSPINKSPLGKDTNMRNSFQNKRDSFVHKESMGISRDLSDKSNNSYIKVSHKQRIKELENVIQEFEDKDTDHRN